MHLKSGTMAVITAEVVLSSGVISAVILLLLAIFITALCSDCKRRSFELQESGLDKHPSTLIKVVRLEDAVRENPMITDIRNDEKDVRTNGCAAIGKTGSSSDATGESSPEEETTVTFTPWRSHLGAPVDQEPDSTHIYHYIGRGSMDANASSNHDDRRSADVDLNGQSVYAQVGKRERQATPPHHSPENAQVDKVDEVSPPLPNRMAELDG
ncbi:uncharacterized protein LOC115410649 isoform X2 [Sphaeramia orbicularis]|uniref:uncharacterized protein LOC115410649 isoform X2 n=1 Tax=Sphaeramia orbicularis TaxID=375764 RepID=UPI00117C1734|nr:uncharacterized protein LOC115410649 isoform X2 [Sphaeramia orbicularis]